MCSCRQPRRLAAGFVVLKESLGERDAGLMVARQNEKEVKYGSYCE